MPKAPLLVIAMLSWTPLAASAQQASPAPRAHNVVSLEQKGSVWQLDFGVPKLPEISEPLGTSHWQFKPAAHVPGIGAWFQKPELPQLTPAPIDCAMVKHGQQTIDPTFEHKHTGHSVLSGRTIFVSPCTAKK